MICRHDTYANSFPSSCLARLMQSLLFSGVLPGSRGIIPSFSPPPFLPPSSNSPLMPMLRPAGRATSPNLTSCCYTNLLMFGLLIAFRPCFLCVQPVPRPTLGNEFMPISSPIQTPQKAARLLFSPSHLFL